MVLRDITELKRLQEKEHEAGRIAAETIEGMVDAVLIMNPEGKILHANKEVERTGYKREEIVGKT